MFGTIYLTSRKENAEAALLNGSAKVVVLDETNPFMDLNNVVMGTVLLPPYEAMAAMVDGEDKIAMQIYQDYLNETTPDTFICVLMAALYKGINLILYVPEDENSFMYGLLVRFTIYGISVGTDTVPFSIINDPFLSALRLSSIYVHDIMAPEDFLRSYPDGYALLDFVIPKLREYYNPSLEDYSEQSYIKYFNNLMDRIKHSKYEVVVPFIRRD